MNSSLQKVFYGRHHNRVDRYEIFISQMTMDLLLFSRCFLSSITANTFKLTDCLYDELSNTTGTAYPSQAREFTLDFMVGPCCSSFKFFVLFIVVYSCSEFGVVLPVVISAWKWCSICPCLQGFCFVSV